MKIKVLSTDAARLALQQANIPQFVTDIIVNKTLDSDEQFNIHIPILSNPKTTWVLPPEAVTIIEASPSFVQSMDKTRQRACVNNKKKAQLANSKTKTQKDTKQ